MISRCGRASGVRARTHAYASLQSRSHLPPTHTRPQDRGTRLSAEVQTRRFSGTMFSRAG